MAIHEREMKKDIDVLRGLAQQVAEISQKDVQEEKRDLWRRHNSLQKTRPLVIVNGGNAFTNEIFPENELKCQDPFFRAYELKLRRTVLTDVIGDDHIVEPWLSVRVSYAATGWGVAFRHIGSSKSGGSYKFDPVIKEPEDIAKLVSPHHVIDEEKTAQNVDRMRDAIGDILEIDVDRGPFYQSFDADISYSIVQLIGLEQLMMYMYDRPEWLHELLRFMQKGILAAHDEAERAEDWRLGNQNNQAEPYSLELPDPKANTRAVRRELWGFFASQEFALISPDMFYEFLLQYQIPIMEKFGLVAYGCCEDLTRKIDYLKKIPNLRRIAVTPWADVGKCAEQIKQDYVLSWRPNPATMVCGHWDPGIIRKTVREAMEASQGCHVDITLKDVQTVRNEPWRLKEWVEIVRDVSDKYV